METTLDSPCSLLCTLWQRLILEEYIKLGIGVLDPRSNILKYNKIINFETTYIKYRNRKRPTNFSSYRFYVLLISFGINLDLISTLRAQLKWMAVLKEKVQSQPQKRTATLILRMKLFLLSSSFSYYYRVSSPSYFSFYAVERHPPVLWTSASVSQADFCRSPNVGTTILKGFQLTPVRIRRVSMR